MKILLINGGKAFAHSGGELNNTLHAVAVDTLKELGHEVRETVIEQGYEVATEVQNFLWADSIVYQMPGWWMGMPAMAALAKTRPSSMAAVAYCKAAITCCR